MSRSSHALRAARAHRTRCRTGWTSRTRRRTGRTSRTRRRTGWTSRTQRTAALTAVLALITACGSADGDEPLRLLAAASLVDVAEEVADDHERDTGVEVLVHADGSQRLAAQVRRGAPGDVLVTADQATMDALADDGHIAQPRETIATNRLVIAVPADDPAGIDGLEALAEESLDVALAAEEVPAGRYTRRLLDAAGVEVSAATLESSVRGVLTKVGLGEVDAGIVYATDAAARDDVAAIEVPERHQPDIRLPAAVLADAAQPQRAAALVERLAGAPGREILAAHGFGPAP